jgi:hypothetical protein
MQRKLFNIVRPREGKDGQTFWDRHGILIVKDGKLSLHLSSIPTGEWDGWFQAFAREEQGQAEVRGNGTTTGNSPTQRFQAQSAPAFDDDIPF